MYLTQPYEVRPIPMAQFDTTAQLTVLRQVLASIKEPRRRLILQNVIDHADAEAGGRYADLMATCSRKRQSYLFSRDMGLLKLPTSYAELETYYADIIASRTWMLHYELDKVVVGDDEVVLDGVMHQLYPTDLLAQLYPALALDPRHRAYQLTLRLCVMFLFDEDGLSAGEHAYGRGDISQDSFSPVEDRYLPDLFKPAA